MADISIPWGDNPAADGTRAETLTIPLPADWTIQQIASPAIPPANADWPQRIAEALARPEGTPPLEKLIVARPNARIVVIVEDLTRHSPLPAILEAVFREFHHANISDENIEIFFATGMHPPLTPTEAGEKIGKGLADKIAWRCNPWRDRKAYVNLGPVRAGGATVDLMVDRGVVNADLRIVITSVSPHLQAGFGGGYKMFLPGCSHLETIRQLHMLSVPRRHEQQVGQAGGLNRMRRLIDAAGQAVDSVGGKSFSLQYILDAADRPSAVAAGDIIACQRMLAKHCASGCGVILEKPADVVIVNAWPRDFDLWQAFKSVANTCWAARDRGVLICLAKCPGGVNMPTPSFPISPKWVRRLVRLLGADSLASLMTRLVPTLSGDAAFFVRLALQILQRTTVMMVSPTLAGAERKMPGLPIYAEAAEAFAAADAELGIGPKRVIVFPEGGVSYPILKNSHKISCKHDSEPLIPRSRTI